MCLLLLLRPHPQRLRPLLPQQPPLRRRLPHQRLPRDLTRLHGIIRLRDGETLSLVEEQNIAGTARRAVPTSLEVALLTRRLGVTPIVIQWEESAIPFARYGESLSAWRSRQFVRRPISYANRARFRWAAH